MEAVVAELGDDGDHALVMKSTVPVGTGRAIQPRPPGLGYVSCPEFLKEGSRGRRLHAPRPRRGRRRPRRRGGADRVAALYAPLGGEMVRTDVASAEMIKLASNAFLATKISFINEIANVSEELGADVREVARGMGLDDRIGPKFLQAGHRLRRLLLPKDVQALKQLAGNTGYHFQLLTAVIEVNELQKRRTIGKLQKHLGSLAGKEIALLGVAFKPDTDDMREATSLVLAARLAGRGRRASAPTTRSRRDGPPSCCAGGRAARLGARGARRRRRRGAGDRVARVRRARLGRRGRGADARPLVVDGRNFLDRDALRAAGFTYEGIGRAVDAPARRRPTESVQALVLAGGEGTRLRPLTADHAEAGDAAGRPAVPLLHARLAAPATAWTRWSSPAASCPTSCARCSATSTPACGCATSSSRSRSAPPARPARRRRAATCSRSASSC